MGVEEGEVLEPDGGGAHAAVDEEEGWLSRWGLWRRVKDLEVAVGGGDERAGDAGGKGW